MSGEPLNPGKTLTAALGYTAATFVLAVLRTSHVPAFVARQAVPQVGLFVLMESVYLALQFGAFGLVPALVWRDS